MQHQDSKFAYRLEILQVRERLEKSLTIYSKGTIDLREHLNPRRVNAFKERSSRLHVNIKHVFDQELRFA